MYVCFIPVVSVDVSLVRREKWEARDTKGNSCMGTPVSVVFIHHTAGSECFNQEDCSRVVRDIQNYHMDKKGISFSLHFVT